MDYEKKYKDALEKAMELRKGLDGYNANVAIIEQIFPELKESEGGEKPNGGIVLEDFNGGEGYYKVHLDYLNKEQIEEIEGLVEKWNENQKSFDYENANIQQKDFASWSEDDEKMIDAALQFAHEYGRHGLWCWLKSLKDRIEVKDVDCDSAVERYIEQHKSELEGGYFDIRRIARHFFNLGLNYNLALKTKGE